jgi:hypothetical protein
MHPAPHLKLLRKPCLVGQLSSLLAWASNQHFSMLITPDSYTVQRPKHSINNQDYEKHLNMSFLGKAAILYFDIQQRPFANDV